MLTLGAWSGACGGSSKPAPLDPDVIVADMDTVLIAPGQADEVHFVVHTAAGAPIAGDLLRFTIYDDPDNPDDQAGGATLAPDTAVTDGQGRAATQVNAGLEALFRVRAHSMRAGDADAAIIVGSGDRGAVEVAPTFPAPGGAAAAGVSAVELSFYDREACGSISLATPPDPVRPRKVVPADGSALFDNVATSGTHAIAVRGFDQAMRVRVAACVDLLGATLAPKRTVRLPVPLVPDAPVLAGTYALLSNLTLAVPAVPTAALAAPWRDLTQCPLDPASILLDCTLDALGGGPPTDPLDCVPSAEGPLGDALTARRGVLAAGCRGALDSTGKKSLEATVAAAFPSPRPAWLSRVAEASGEAGRLFGAPVLRSTLQIGPELLVGHHLADHTLGALVFTLGGVSSVVDLEALAVPVRTARGIGVERHDDTIEVAQHGLTMRLGSAGRVAFGALSLEPRGIRPDTSSFVVELMGLVNAKPMGGGPALTGCAALDLLLCTDAGQAPGCLGKACDGGLPALVAKLDAGFAALDGDDLDLLLSGNAPVRDGDADGHVDVMGDPKANPPRPGLWTGEVRTRAGKLPTTGSWTGQGQ